MVAEQKTGKLSWRKIALGPLVVAGLITIFVIGNALSDFGFPSFFGESTTEEPSKLFLTLEPSGDASDDLSLYVYDLNTNTLGKMEIPGLSTGTNISNKFSPDGKRMAFAHANDQGPMHIYVVASSIIASGVSFGDAPQQVSSSRVQFKREPVWSSDGKKLVYVGQDSAAGFRTPENWQIYSVDISTKEEILLTTGYNPLFSPDGKKLLVLKDDGIHLFDIERKISERVWAVVGGKANDLMKLSLSSNGDYLVWSDHVNDETNLFSIKSWDPLSIEKIKTIKAIQSQVIYSVFSSDGRYLALEEASLDHRTFNVIIYRLLDFEPEKTISFDGYEEHSAWFTDFR